MREIEIKLKVKGFEELENKLKEAGCVLSGPISQYDVIYSAKSDMDEFMSSKEGDIIMRIRRMENVAQLNLKQQKSSEMDNLEYETEIKNPEAADKMLKALGWHPAIEVKKIRRKGKLGNYEICLDDVEKLGAYVELEKMADDGANPYDVRKELFEALKPFGLFEKDEETKGYDTLIYLLNNKK